MFRKKWLLFLAAVLCLAGCVAFFPCLQTVRDGEGWQYSAANLKQIGMALHSYHEVYGRLPPAVKLSKDGEPLYSWRVLVLPFLEHQNLFHQFNLDEPWDGSHNKALLKKIPRFYMLPRGRNDVPGMTHYQVLVGPGTASEQDDSSDMFLVVEAATPVPWTKPEDLVYVPGKSLPALGGLFQKPIHLWCYVIGRKDGCNACFADGNVRFIPNDTDEQTLRSHIARNDDEPGKPE
jgi:prepilin-type processing-associated H-X9-DG protein